MTKEFKKYLRNGVAIILALALASWGLWLLGVDIRVSVICQNVGYYDGGFDGLMAGEKFCVERIPFEYVIITHEVIR